MVKSKESLIEKLKSALAEYQERSADKLRESEEVKDDDESALKMKRI